MKKAILYILLFVAIISLCSCSKQSDFSGVYEVSNGIYTDTEEWVLAKDGTAVGKTSNGRVFTFKWSAQNDMLYISQLINLKDEVEYYGKLIKGDKYTIFDMQTATTIIRKSLTRKGDAPKTAFNQFPDEAMIIGYYICNDTEYSFSKDGQFTYSGPADKFKCPYSVIGNRITLQLGNATYYKADGEFFLSGMFSIGSRYEFSFDVSENVLTVFSNHRSQGYRSSNTDIFITSILNRVDILEDTSFDESSKDPLFSTTVYWSLFGSHEYHTFSDCPRLFYGESIIQSGTFVDYLNSQSARIALCDICAGRDDKSNATPSDNDIVTVSEQIKAAKALQDYTINQSTGTAAPISVVDENYLILVNRTHPLSQNYVPSDLVKVDSSVSGVGIPGETDQLRMVAANAFEEMVKAANKLGIEIRMRTGYRSYEYQRDKLYNPSVKSYGKEHADVVTEKPGQSEHQTGLALDIGWGSEFYAKSYNFMSSAEGKWLTDHCHEYGFILRYTNGTKDSLGEITRHVYEPWHLRYVGVEAATYIHMNGLLLEECLDVVD